MFRWHTGSVASFLDRAVSRSSAGALFFSSAAKRFAIDLWSSVSSCQSPAVRSLAANFDKMEIVLLESLAK